MKIEQIVAYLLVSTVIVIFSVLVLFTMVDSVGNGGGYWGYDGRVDPRLAARDAFDDGDYRLLDVALPPHDNRLTDNVPGVALCEGGVGKYYAGVRRSSGEPRHAESSIRLATEFAREFNWELALDLNNVFSAGCEINWSRR